MKIVIIDGSIRNKRYLVQRLENFFQKESFSFERFRDDNGNVRSVDEQIRIINRINLENKEWFIEGNFSSEFDFLFNLATDIIFLDDGFKKKNNDYEWDRKEVYDRIRKYSRKLIILKSKKEIKKMMDAFDESF